MENDQQTPGVYIPVDLDRLIDRIYISPYAPDWFRELIAGVNKRFGPGKQIVHSSVFGGQPRARKLHTHPHKKQDK